MVLERCWGSQVCVVKDDDKGRVRIGSYLCLFAFETVSRPLGGGFLLAGSWGSGDEGN